MRPGATYETIVSTEIAFQRYIENTSSSDALMNWLENILPAEDFVLAGFGLDTMSGVLRPLMENLNTTTTLLPLRALIGPEAVANGFQCHYSFNCNKEDAGVSTRLALTNLVGLNKVYPTSYLIRALIAKINAGYNMWVAEMESKNLNCYLKPYTKLNVDSTIPLKCRLYPATEDLKFAPVPLFLRNPQRPVH